jgi:tRNA/rRNA methyltransferase
MSLDNISIILIKPQMGENIGATARAMKNFGITNLRIVAPRDGWPNPKAHDMAASADDIIESAQIFQTTEDAIADLQMVFATASKPRDMVKDVITPEHAAMLLNSHHSSLGAEKVGLLLAKNPMALITKISLTPITLSLFRYQQNTTP